MNTTTVSDVDNCVPGCVCQTLTTRKTGLAKKFGKPTAKRHGVVATVVIEWETEDGYRYWTTHCDVCARQELAPFGSIVEVAA